MMHDRNIYANPELGISIEKPGAWRFIPAQWALILLLSRVEPSQAGVDELVRYTREPLFYFHYDHGLVDQVLPTVCGMHKVSPGIGSADRGVLLRMQVVQLQAVFDDFELIEATPDGLISQRPANIIRSTFTAYGRDGCRLECLSRCYLVFTGDIMFSIEMSGPAQGEYRSEEEFRDILGSLRID
jgi:hypothetical protein